MKQTIFVVGAGPGLGNAVAEKFGSAGFRVVLMARSAEHLKSYAEDFQSKGIEAHTQVADVSDGAAFAEAFARVVEQFGTPDVVFYNVGVTVADQMIQRTAQTLVERFEVDVVGAYRCIELLDMTEFSQKNGAILVTGGGLALEPNAGYLPLSMDKAALRAMVLALSPYFAEQGVYIGTVTVTNVIGSNDHFAPSAIADQFWTLYTERNTPEIIY